MANLADKTQPFGEIGDPEEWKPPKDQISVDGFQESALGLFLPTDNHQQIRTIYFFQGMAVQVLETQDQIRKLMDAARDLPDARWVQFHEVQLGEVVSVPLSALEHLCWVGESWVDVTASREQMRQRELQAKMMKSGIQVARDLPAGRSNGKRR